MNLREAMTEILAGVNAALGPDYAATLDVSDLVTPGVLVLPQSIARDRLDAGTYVIAAQLSAVCPQEGTASQIDHLTAITDRLDGSPWGITSEPAELVSLTLAPDTDPVAALQWVVPVQYDQTDTPQED